MRKIAVALAAGSLTAGLAVAAPAYADDASSPSVTVTSKRTGGIQGVYGDGAGSIANTGNTVIPAGTTFTVELTDMPGLPDEIHANYLNFSDSGFMKIRSMDLASQKWKLTTKKDLKPGEVKDYKYKVLHYALWHRVKHDIKLDSVPGQSSVSGTKEAAGVNL